MVALPVWLDHTNTPFNGQSTTVSQVVESLNFFLFSMVGVSMESQGKYADYRSSFNVYGFRLINLVKSSI